MVFVLLFNDRYFRDLYLPLESKTSYCLIIAD